jgi:ubiquinone/menaquinone biosynthesis C-methylase UbiE
MSADAHDPPRLRDLWEQQASNWTRWSREPGHDAYWHFHRDAFLRLVPAPGHLTFDIGCGEGRLLRDLAHRGHRVVGLDAAPTMVRGARDMAPELAVVNGDAAALPFASAVADLIVAFMSLQDVDDMQRAVREARRVLREGGALCMAVVHPLNSAGSFSGRDPEAPFVVDGSYLESRRYHDEVERNGLPMTFHSHHRSLEEYSRALEDAGMLVEAIREVTVDGETTLTRRDDARWLRIPLFLHLRARATAWAVMRGPTSSASSSTTGR